MASATILISFRFLHRVHTRYSLFTTTVIHHHHHSLSTVPIPGTLQRVIVLPALSRVDCSLTRYRYHLVHRSLTTNPPSHPDTPRLTLFFLGTDLRFSRHCFFSPSQKFYLNQKFSSLSFLHLLALTLFLRLRRETRNSSVIYTRSSLAPYSPHANRQFVFTSLRSSSTLTVRCKVLSAARNNAHRSAGTVESRPR